MQIIIMGKYFMFFVYKSLGFHEVNANISMHNSLQRGIDINLSNIIFTIHVISLIWKYMYSMLWSQQM